MRALGSSKRTRVLPRTLSSTLLGTMWQLIQGRRTTPQSAQLVTVGMHEFLYTTFGYPTIIFTVLLMLAFLYWTLVILGVLGIEVLDIDVDVDGVAEGMNGAAEGVVATEGVAAEGASDGGSAMGLLAALLHGLRLNDVPLTLVLSMVTLLSWIIAQVCSSLVLVHWDSGARWVGGTVVLVVAPVIALFASGVLLRPLGGLLKPEPQTRREDWVGKIVVIDTSRVDRSFGTARADDGGAGLILQVRCDPGNGLQRGSRALVIAFDVGSDAYEVAPVDDMLSAESRPS